MPDNQEARPADFDGLRKWLARLRLDESPGEAVDQARPSASPLPLPGSGPTLVVARSGPADHKSLREAIRTAPPGARILVRPGRYEEGLVLEKPLEICGEGPAQEIVLQTPDAHGLLLQTSQARVRGLTLRCLGASKGNKLSAVEVPRGQLVLEDCDLTSDTLACVSVHGPTAEVVLRRCRIHDGAASGVLVAGRGRATIEECDIFGNGEAGVLSHTGGEPLVRNCRIHDGKLFGVLAAEGGKGTVEDCDFTGNAVAGVGISGGDPVVRRCRIHDPKMGVLAFLGGGGIVEDCDLSGNHIGVLITEGGNPLIRRCQIHDSSLFGVSVKKKGRGTVEDCDIFHSARAGVHIIEVSIPVIRRCRIHEGRQFGVFVNAAGVGTVEECDIFGNGLAEVAVSEDGNPFLRGCRLHDGKRFGLSVQLKGEASVVDCEIFGNAQAGVLIRTGGNPVLRRCKINRNGAQGVRVQEHGLGTFENCDLTGNTSGGWDIEASCRVQRRGNQE